MLKGIKASKGLEELIPHVKQLTEQALDERGKLNLDMPDKFDVWINYYSSVYRAETHPRGFIIINTLNRLINKFAEEERVKEIKEYFQKYWEMEPQASESYVLNSLDNPEVFLDMFKNSNKFNEFNKTIKSRGLSFEQYEQFFLGRSAFIKKHIEKLTPRVIDLFNSSAELSVELLASFKHEIDHVAFFRKKIWKDEKLAETNIEDIKKRVYPASSINEDLASAKIEYLNTFIKCRCELEQRAYFLGHLKLGEISEGVDMENIAGDVYSHFIQSYVKEIYPIIIVEAILAQYYKEINEDSKLYVREEALKATDYFNFLVRKKPCLKKVNYRLVSKILDKDIPYWQRKFKARATTTNKHLAAYYLAKIKNLKD